MNLREVDTPCCVVDTVKTEKNIATLHSRLNKLGAGLRVHGKTVKNIELLRPAMKGQPGGITVSTLKEAEYFFDRGITDITYAVGIAPSKLDRIASLIMKGAGISVILDTVEQAAALSSRGAEYGIDIPFLIEIDSDGERGGIRPGERLLPELLSVAAEKPGAEPAGVLTHAGGSYHCDSIRCIIEMAEAERRSAVQAAEILRSSGIRSPVVSVGSTPTAYFAENLEGVTEVRAGVFIFQDLTMAALGVCVENEIAVSVLASVIGYQKDKGWIITDAGWMALSNAPPAGGYAGHGIVCDIDGAVIPGFIVSSTSQEHGIISSLSGLTPDFGKFGIGSRVRILPNHACAMAAMHDYYYTVNGDTGVTGRLDRINGW